MHPYTVLPAFTALKGYRIDIPRVLVVARREDSAEQIVEWVETAVRTKFTRGEPDIRVSIHTAVWDQGVPVDRFKGRMGDIFDIMRSFR